MTDKFRMKMQMNRITRTFSVEKDLKIPKDSALSLDREIQPSHSAGLRDQSGNISFTKEDSNEPLTHLQMFEDKDFDPQVYIRDQLSKNTEDGVRNQFAALKEAAAQSAAELQKNVHRNYHEFIKTSKAISVMETDMLTVRAMLNELRTVSQDLLDGDEPEIQIEPKEAGDSESKELLQIKQQRKLEIAKIVAEIEGAQAFLEGPDRYQISEGDLVELDPDDYHTAKVVHINLFNDGLMISSVKKAVKTHKKKTSIIQPNKLVAEKFLQLKDLAVVNVRDSEELRNAFKLMKHPATYLFKATGKEDKLRWVGLIKDGIDNQMKVTPKPAEVSGKVAKTGEEETSSSDEEEGVNGKPKTRRRRKLASFFGDTSQDRKKKPPKLPEPESTPSPSGTQLKPRKSLNAGSAKKMVQEVQHEEEEEAAEKPQEKVVDMSLLRQLTENSEELDVFIALRQFDQAINLIDRIAPLLASLPNQSNEYHIFKKLIDSQILKLADSIGQDLRNPLSTKFQVKENISRLMRLGLLDQAREIFLSTQTVIIKHKIKKLRFEGEIYSYIKKLSQVVFYLLKNTCVWYKGFFDDPNLSSGFVKWITQEIEDYCSIFRRHVFQNQNFQITTDCLRVAAEHCSSLRLVGFDFLFIIEQFFNKDVAETILALEGRLESQLAKQVATDSWTDLHVLTRVFVPFGGSSEDLEGAEVTESAFKVHQIMMTFLEDLDSFFSPDLYEVIVTSLCNMFDKYTRLLLETSTSMQLSLEQRFGLMTDVVFVVGSLLPLVNHLLTRRFGKMIPEFERLEKSLAGHQVAICDVIAKEKAAEFLQEYMTFSQADYISKPLVEKEKVYPSDNMMNAVRELIKISQDLKRPRVRTLVLSSLVNQIILLTSQLPMWTSVEYGPLTFGHPGIIYFIIDVEFFAGSLQRCLSPEIQKQLQGVIAQLHQKFGEKNPTKAVPPMEWFEKRGPELVVIFEKKSGAVTLH